MELIKLTGAIITLIGSIFILIGAIGIMRMPDVFNRIQAGTKASTLGTLLTMIGLMMVYPEWWGKLLILAIFILITNPVSSHVLARAAHYIKTPLTDKTVTDQYKKEDTTYKVNKEIKNE